MSSAFRTSIRKSIANPALQIALDNNAQRRVAGRVTAFASLPDWRERRQRAHQVRAEVIAHLDEYLERFTQKLTQNGIQVHRAADSAEAIRMVLDIAGASHPGPSLFAKSKSMVSEEINLNHALEAHGHRVVETDLGEYIVQLRGEKPAHIITPAVHLRRHEVGQLFQEKLGIPYTEDIPTLTTTARKVLRQVFLTADIGLTGVNFGVAESGSLCIVTNEGNGRMVTSVPPVHIALMGMERLVPTLDDLALMLTLLPRSATGQKLSVYTQIIHSPRRAGEVDGARERHVIILDNGRSQMRSSPLQEALYCIRCGACLNACPVFRELGGHAYVGADGSIAPYPGPIGSVVSPGLLGLEQFGHLAQASSLCGACKDACPVDIDLPKLLVKVRSGQDLGTSPNQSAVKNKPGTGLSFTSRIGLQLYGRIASSAGGFALSQKLAGIGTRLLSPFSDWFRIPAFTGWGYSKDFPRFAVKPFHERFKEQKETPPGIQPIKVQDQAPAVPAEETEDLVQRFIQELEALGGHAQRVKSNELSGHILDILKKQNIDAALIWDKIPGLDEADLTGSGLRVVKSPDASIKAGITGAAWAIADTGTIVIPSGEGQPLGASLLPEIHIAVVRASRMLLSLDQAMMKKEVRDAASLALVTGPSRTADIEMTLTIGVHGPGELDVFIVDD